MSYSAVLFAGSLGAGDQHLIEPPSSRNSRNSHTPKKTHAHRPKLCPGGHKLLVFGDYVGLIRHRVAARGV
jgi:hypothetical protein